MNNSYETVSGGISADASFHSHPWQPASGDEDAFLTPQQFLYFNPDPQGHGSFLPVVAMTVFSIFDGDIILRLGREHINQSQYHQTF